jgi:hypothetical protein
MRSFILSFMMGCLVLSLGTIGLFSQPLPEFSLDGYPAMFGSAENEWGQANAAFLAGFIGPSPSLVMSPIAPLYDSDVLTSFAPPGAPPGHLLLTRFAPPPPMGSPFYVDAVSNNKTAMSGCQIIFVEFSVDRATGGATPANASWQQARLNEQPADIYRVANPGFAHLGLFVTLPLPGAGWPPFYGGPVNPANGFTSPPYALPGPAGSGGVNNLLYDQAVHFNLLPNVAPYPRIAPGTHDNIDGYSRWLFSMLAPANSAIFFCLHPASGALWGFSAADILYCNQPGGLYWPATGVYAFANQMGLDNFGFNSDSIDGLSVFDNGTPGVLEPGTDYAGFTLAPGSATLMWLVNNGFPVNAASILMTDFQGFFYLYLFDTDLGVGNGPNVLTPPPNKGPLPVIPFVDINVDALELTIDPVPLPYTNPITRPNIDPITKN